MVSISPNPTQKKKYDWRILVVDDTPIIWAWQKQRSNFMGSMSK